MEQREAESSRLGRLLHDEAGQLLTAAGLHLDALRREIPADGTGAARIDEIQKIFDDAINVLRAVSNSLPATDVERTGLAAALDRLIGRFRQQSKCTIRAMVDSHVHTFGDKARALYRIAEYAIDNSIKHGSATLIEVLFRQTSRGLELEIRDDGRGFDLDAARDAPRGMGLLVMEHTAARADLQLNIQTALGAGTIVRILDAV